MPACLNLCCPRAALCAAAALLAGCQLQEPPWSGLHAGTSTLATTAGKGSYEADVKVTTIPTAAAPFRLRGVDTSDLKTRYGYSLKYEHLLLDDWAVGAGFTFRRLNPSPVRPLTSTLVGDHFNSNRITLQTRYYLPPLEEGSRLRPVAAVIASYIPEVSLDATAIYAPGIQERIRIRGDGYWVAGLSGALSILLLDNLSLEVGGFYEVSLTKSEALLRFHPPPSGALAPVWGQVDSRLLLVTFGLTLYF